MNNVAIEFARGIDTLGDGKLISLPTGEATLSQLTILTEQDLEADLKITITNITSNTVVTCVNVIQQSKQRPLLLTGTCAIHRLTICIGMMLYYCVWSVYCVTV